MPKKTVQDILTPLEIELVRKTLDHFLRDPDYATGDERGLSFTELEFGQALPVEVVIRDWRTDLEEGAGGREFRNGDCYSIYVKLYEEGHVPSGDIDRLFPNYLGF